MKNELMDKDTHKRSLLSEAAISENKGLFDAVLATVKKRLSDDQVHNASIPWSVCVGKEYIDGLRVLQHVTAADL